MKKQEILSHLRNISPRWAEKIERNMKHGKYVEDEEYDDGLKPPLDIAMSARCIVGEAYHFKPDYGIPGGTEDIAFCNKCDYLSMQLYYNLGNGGMPTDMKTFWENIRYFCEHFEEEHRVETCTT